MYGGLLMPLLRMSSFSCTVNSWAPGWSHLDLILVTLITTLTLLVCPLKLHHTCQRNENTSIACWDIFHFISFMIRQSGVRIIGPPQLPNSNEADDCMGLVVLPMFVRP